jgi:SpoIID/LytB domain protein
MVVEAPGLLFNSLHSMKHYCLLLLVFLFTGLYGAEYHEGQLFLEINIATESNLNIKLAKKGTIKVSEAEGLMSRDFSSDIRIAMVNAEEVSYYGILRLNEEVPESIEDDHPYVREYFAWENSHLVIKRECLQFLPQSFAEKAEAENYALQQRLSPSRIMEIPMINSTITVTSSKGETMYLETPLRLSSSSDLYINDQKYGYSGDFILKTVKGRLVLNQLIGLEDYLAGVIQNEIGNNSPLEALKAQTVAARTHALSLLVNNRHKQDGYDLCNGTHCQVYKGTYLYNSQVQKAVFDTYGEALFVNSVIADATYHSSCGGKTDASSAIWKGKPLAHLNGVTCIPEVDTLDLTQEKNARAWIDQKGNTAGMSSWERGALNWEKSISNKQLAQSLGLGYVKKIEIQERGRSGRILKMKFYGDSVVSLDNEYKIRQAFGNLLSSFFYIKGSYTDSGNTISMRAQSVLQLSGKGAGHGVGMCQVGALREAREGRSYQEILQHYYPGTTISKDWNIE